MPVLLHPTINWQGWQEVKQSREFQQLPATERIRLVNQLPHCLWTWELSDNGEIDLLLDSLGRERHEQD